MSLTQREQRVVESIRKEQNARGCMDQFCKVNVFVLIPLVFVGALVKAGRAYVEYDALARQVGGYAIVERTETENRGPTRDEWNLMRLSNRLTSELALAFSIGLIYLFAFLLWRQRRLIVKLARALEERKANDGGRSHEA